MAFKWSGTLQERIDRCQNLIDWYKRHPSDDPRGQAQITAKLKRWWKLLEQHGY